MAYIYTYMKSITDRRTRCKSVSVISTSEKKQNTLRRDSRGNARTHAEKKHVDTRRVHFTKKPQRECKES